MSLQLDDADESGLITPQEIATENHTSVVWKLAWPVVALNSLQVVNTLLDRFFIGHLPSEALTAQGSAINVMFLMFSLAMALGTGSTALVSRAFGAGKIEELRIAAKQSVGLAVIAGLISGLVAALLAYPASQFFLPPGEATTAALMTKFILSYAIGLPAIYVIQTLAGALRGIGDSKSPMYISGLQILLHISLNFILIYPPRTTFFGLNIPGFGLGLVGAGLALSISAWVAALIYFAYSVRTPLGSQWILQSPRWVWASRILKVAVPAAGMAVLRVGSFMAFTKILTQIPGAGIAATAIAGMSVAFAIESIMFMPAFGLSMAAASLVGQSLGMKRPERAERLTWIAANHGALVTAVISIPIFIFAYPIALTMVGEKHEIAAQASHLIRALSVTEFFFAYGMVMTGAMQGAGDTVRPMWITLCSTWFLRVPLSAFLALGFPHRMYTGNLHFLGYGAAGAWFAMSVTQAIHGALSIHVFRQGKWKTKKV